MGRTDEFANEDSEKLRSAKCANHFDRLCMLKHTAPSQGKVGA
jgi:hypothetical protein